MKTLKGLMIAMAAAALACVGIYGAGTTVAGTRIINGDLTVKGTCTGCGAAIGGSNTQVLYNNSGVMGGITGATTNGTALTLVAPVLGTPASGTLTNATGLPCATGIASAYGCLLESHTASASTSLDFTCLGSGTYKVFRFNFLYVVPTTNVEALNWLASEDGGSTWITTSNIYNYVFGFTYPNTGGASSASAAAGPIIGANISNDAHYGITGYADVYAPANTTAYKLMKFQTGVFDTAANNVLFSSGDSRYLSTNAINAIRFQPGATGSGHTFASGTIDCLGVY